MRHNNTNTSLSEPSEISVAILGWMANEPDILARFLALSGVETTQLRTALNDPGFLAGLLDFVMGHEPDLLAFCAATGMTPQEVSAAWQKLSGPGLDSGEY